MADSIAIGCAFRDQSIVGGSITSTPVSATTLAASGASTLNGSVLLGAAAANGVGFYGKVPVVQRTFVSSLHNTSAMITSAGSLFQATHVAQIQEIQNTLIGVGLWATA